MHRANFFDGEILKDGCRAGCGSRKHCQADLRPYLPIFVVWWTVRGASVCVWARVLSVNKSGCERARERKWLDDKWWRARVSIFDVKFPTFEIVTFYIRKVFIKVGTLYLTGTSTWWNYHAEVDYCNCNYDLIISLRVPVSTEYNNTDFALWWQQTTTVRH